MEKSINVKIVDFKENLIKITNEANLPVMVAYYVLNEVVDMVKEQSLSIVSSEIKAIQEYERNKTIEELSVLEEVKEDK